MALPPEDPGPVTARWPSLYGRETPPPLDPLGGVLSISNWTGRPRVRRANPPGEELCRDWDRTRRAYAAWLRYLTTCDPQPSDEVLQGEEGSYHWLAWYAGYTAAEVDGDAGALENHAAFLERVRDEPALGYQIIEDGAGRPAAVRARDFMSFGTADGPRVQDNDHHGKDEDGATADP